MAWLKGVHGIWGRSPCLSLGDLAHGELINYQQSGKQVQIFQTVLQVLYHLATHASYLRLQTQPITSHPQEKPRNRRNHHNDELH